MTLAVASLIGVILDIASEVGEVTVDGLQERLPYCTPKQIRNVIYRAVSQGQLTIGRVLPRCGKGGQPATSYVYVDLVPAPASVKADFSIPPPGVPCSVWQLGVM